ncbi:MAG TPA: protoglobin family protein [Methylomirabilota bacterium]|nr:protoglobin family protein [Methylomirabilota bacterium]
MSAAPEYLPATDIARFLREAAAFVGLGEAELALVRRTAPVVLAHEPALTAALYEHFLGVPAAARFFLGEDGAPDLARLERRKHSLGRWLRETCDAALTADFGYYVLAVGLAHSHRAAGPGGRVPAHLVVGAMSLLQTALARLFARELDDPREALAASVAWNQLLLVQLEALLLGYLPR